MATIDDIAPDLENFVGAKQALLTTMTSAFRSGASASAIVGAVGAAFSRDQVYQYFAAVELHDKARKALAEAGLSSVVDVTVSGMSSPREARVTISAAPDECSDYSLLPERIRDALRDFHITLDAPAGEHDEEVTTALLDQFLLQGESARLVKVTPRT